MSKIQLTVDIDYNTVKFTRLNGVNIEQQFLFEFTDKTDFGYKNQLGLFLAETKFRNLEWDEYSLSWFSHRSTLLPFTIFNEVEPKKVFELSFGKEVPSDEIDFNRIPEFTGVNIYEIPVWVKSFFVTKFPRMILQHEGSHLLRGLVTGGSYGLSLIVCLHKEHFMLIAVKNTEVQFYNTFEFHNMDDILYHTAHVLTESGWTEEKNKLFLVDTLLNNSEFTVQLKNKMEAISQFKQSKITHSNHLVSQFQILCV